MHVPLGGDHVADLRPDGRIISPDWPGNALVYSQREWRKLRRIREFGSLSWSCYPRDPIPDNRLKMDGWMDKKKHPGQLTHGSSHTVGWWYRGLAVDG